MENKMQSSAKKVQDFLIENGLSVEVKEFPASTRTAKDAANTIGCSVAEIAKSLIFKDRASGDPILVIASGINRVDVKKIKKATGLKLDRADGDFVKERVGFAIGGVPPFGHIEKIKTFLDQDLKQFETIWAAAGTPFAVFSLKVNQLQSLTNGEFVDLAE